MGSLSWTARAQTAVEFPTVQLSDFKKKGVEFPSSEYAASLLDYRLGVVINSEGRDWRNQ